MPETVTSGIPLASEMNSAAPATSSALRRLTIFTFCALVLLAILTAGWLVFYFQIREIRIVASAGISAGVLIASLISYLGARKQSLRQATVWLLIAAVLIPFILLLVTGAEIQLALIGAILLGVAVIAIWPNQVWYWIIFISAYGFFYYSMWQLIPGTRFSLGTLPFATPLISGVSAGFGLNLVVVLGLALRASSIRTRLLVILAASAIVPTILITAVTAYNGRNNTQTELVRHLDAITTLKEKQLQTYLDLLKNNLRSIWNENEDVQVLIKYLQVSPTDANFDLIVFSLNTRWNLATGDNDIFDEISFADKTGKVVISTNQDKVGTKVDDQLFFQEGLKKEAVQTTLLSGMSAQSAFIVSRPILDEHGDPVGVLAGRGKPAEISKILIERTGLGTSGETYIVGNQYETFSWLHFPNSDGGIPATVRTQATEALMKQHANGNGLYENYQGIPVIGVYHWQPDLQLGLIAEQTTDEAFRTYTATNQINLGVMAATLLLAVIVSLVLAGSIANPIFRLTRTAQQIAAGNTGLRADVTSSDEIGILASTFNKMTDELQQFITQLEERVAERTRTLERRSAQLQASAEVARDITSATSLDELLSQAVNLIRERFGFYHAGLFLLDENGEYAVLRAATGDAGRQMLSRHHRLKVGEVGLVGYVTGRGQARIALDTGTDAVHFKNPYLPATRSEAAIPLIVNKNVIGALDVQSTEPQAFSEEDVTVLRIMSDQLAIAIENTRLLQRMNNTVSELEKAYGTYTRESWQEMTATLGAVRGYRTEQTDIVETSQRNPEAVLALENGEVVQNPAVEDSEIGASLAVPIKLRNQVIGVLNLRFNTPTISDGTSELVQEAASRLALVLENTRLLQDAQRLAQREQQINVISQQIRGSINTDTILQNTVRELGKALGAARAYIQISTEDLIATSGAEHS